MRPRLLVCLLLLAVLPAQLFSLAVQSTPKGPAKAQPDAAGASSTSTGKTP